MKNKRGFTLVELLAVIVILAVILVIAVPQIMSTIENARKGSLESTAKLITSGAEKRLLENETLGITKKIKCSDVVELDSDTYGLCKLTFDDNGNASVIINGAEGGKFDNIGCSGTKDNITCQEGEILPGLNCTYDGELVEGLEFTNGQYTYRYKQEYMADPDNKVSGWMSIEEDGWGVILTDKSSTAPVNTPVCSYINGKPLVSTSVMFGEYDSSKNPIVSKATSIDVSSWETDNVTNMYGMFAFAQPSEIKGLKHLETGNVINMKGMFMNTQANYIDISNFDTSKVQSMSHLFYLSNATTINLKGINTSNVIDMERMFLFSKVTSIDLSSFDTSNVTNMMGMFIGSVATTGYARTQEDADKFNDASVTNIPSTLRFTLKTVN